MIFFTPTLLELCGANDHDTATEAHNQWDKVSEEYKASLTEIKNPHVQELACLCLHDARVVYTESNDAQYDLIVQPEDQVHFIRIRFSLVSPKEIIPHNYDLETTYFYWLYEEVAIDGRDTDDPHYTCSILFSKGKELVLRFSDVSIAQINIYDDVKL